MSESAFDSDRIPDRAECKYKDCDGNLEANVKLHLSLFADGHWEIVGVEDESARVTCDAVEHDQQSQILDKSLTAFLEQTFPGCTWQGSKYLMDLSDIDNEEN